MRLIFGWLRPTAHGLFQRADYSWLRNIHACTQKRIYLLPLCVRVSTWKRDRWDVHTATAEQFHSQSSFLRFLSSGVVPIVGSVCCGLCIRVYTCVPHACLYSRAGVYVCEPFAVSVQCMLPFRSRSNQKIFQFGLRTRQCWFTNWPS